MIRMVAALLATSLCVVLGARALAQEPPAYLLAQYERAANRTLDAVMTKIRPILSREETRLLGAIEIEVNDEWNIFGVRATRSGSVRKVEIPMGFIIAVDQLDQAVILNQLSGRSGDDEVMGYLNYLVNAARANVRRMLRNEPIDEISTFHSYAGYTQSEYERITRSSQYTALLEDIKLHTFAIVLGHELGHHFSGHLENDHSSLAEELEADSEAVRLAVAAGYNPMAAVTPFVFLAAINNDSGIYDRRAHHPPPLCRAIGMLQIGADELEKDPEFIQYMRASGQLASWRSMLSELQQVMSEDVECPADGTAQTRQN